MSNSNSILDGILQINSVYPKEVEKHGTTYSVWTCNILHESEGQIDVNITNLLTKPTRHVIDKVVEFLATKDVEVEMLNQQLNSERQEYQRIKQEREAELHEKMVLLQAMEEMLNQSKQYFNTLSTGVDHFNNRIADVEGFVTNMRNSLILNTTPLDIM
jgi:hypothetical protein